MMKNSRTKIELSQSAIILLLLVTPYGETRRKGGGQGDDWKALGGRRASVEGS